MQMRQFVLNHASLVGKSQADVVPLLRDVVDGMTMLVSKNVARPILSAYTENPQIRCPDPMSLNDFIWSDALEIEFRIFLSGVISKISLLDNLEENYKDRFIGCEYLSSSSSEGKSISLTSDEGAPLVLCAVTDWIATGFATNDWDCEQIVVHFNELMDDGSTKKVSEKIENLTRPHHAKLIYKSHYTQLQQQLSKESFGEYKNLAFPCLMFGQNVDKYIIDIQVQEFSTVVKKLKLLDEICEEWRMGSDSFPEFPRDFSQESESVRNDPKLYKKRTFVSSDGTSEIFEWHARFGSSGRIHFRILEDKKKIEIGYIGPHLPTKNFP